MDLVRETEMGKGEERLRLLVFFPLLENSLCPFMVVAAKELDCGSMEKREEEEFNWKEEEKGVKWMSGHGGVLEKGHKLVGW